MIGLLVAREPLVQKTLRVGLFVVQVRVMFLSVGRIAATSG